MNRQFSLKKLISHATAAVGFAWLLIPQPSFANPSDATNPQNYNSPNINDPFNQGVEQDTLGSNLFQLIHRANLGNLNPDFASEQREQLDAAAEAFKTKRQLRFQQAQPQPTQPGSQVITIPVATPESGN
jgi:hypothetical protein